MENIKENVDNKGMAFLKGVALAGGAYEIMMGLVMIFCIRQLFGFMGGGKEISHMMFPWCMGVLAISFGLLMIGAARDPERYILIILISILLRVMIQFPIIASGFANPEMVSSLIGFGVFDLLFGAITGYAVYHSGINWKNV